MGREFRQNSGKSHYRPPRLPDHLPPPQRRKAPTCPMCGEILVFQLDGGVATVAHNCPEITKQAIDVQAMNAEHQELQANLKIIEDNFPSLIESLRENLEAEEKEDMKADLTAWTSIRLTLDPTCMSRIAVLASKSGYTMTHIARHLVRVQLTMIQDRLTEK